MALHLRFAPSAELLVEPLLQKLQELWQDPFAPPQLLVPNPALGKWLSLRLVDQAERGLGCVLGLERITLERFLWQNLNPDSAMRRLGSDSLGQVLCALLTDEFLSQPELEPVRRYVLDSTGQINPLRRVQLATRFARLFQEYEFNRPSVWDADRKTWRLDGMDALWLRGGSYFAAKPDLDESVLATEKWQSLLYREAMRVFAPQSEKTSEHWISLPHLHRLRREQGVDGKPWCVPAGPIILFQVAKVSHFHRNILIEISQMPGVELYVFLTNPCAEFWEDVDTRRHKTPRRAWNHRSPPAEAGVSSRLPSDYGQSELTAIAPQQKDHPLLELWGHTGKENIYLWCPEAQWDFVYTSPQWAEETPSSVTLLQSLQLSLLRREVALPPPEGSDACNPNNSLQVWESPDLGLEVEFLRANILELVSNGTLERLEDAVVYLPDPVAYLPHIQRVFGAYAPHDSRAVPYAVLGVPGSDSLFAQGALALFEIMQGNFDRPHVFTLLRNPLVQAALRVDAAEVRIWEDWAAALGIFRGFDRAHRSRMGDQGGYANEAHTFSLGLSRLLAGNLAMGEVDLGYGDPVTVYRDFASSDAAQLAHFVTAVESLYNDVENFLLVQSQHDLAATVKALRELVWNWLGQTPRTKGWNAAGEERVRHEFMQALDLLSLQMTLTERNAMSLAEFIDHLRGFLPDELPASSKAWVGGVTFAPLRSGMVIPHKVVYVLGLNSDVFPGSSNRSPSDLLSVQRIVGDPDPVRDNRFVFLELVHAAQAQLVLSYRARNMQKEQELQPSSVILELEAYLLTQKINSIRKKLVWAPWESMEPAQLWEESSVVLSALQSAPRYAQRYTEVVRESVAESRSELRTTLYDVRTFFKNPLEYHLRHALNLSDESDPKTLASNDEPLSSGNLAWSALQKKVLIQVLQQVFPLDGHALALGNEEALCVWARQLAERVYVAHRFDGTAPEAQFAQNECEMLGLWAEKCVPLALDLRCHFDDHGLLCDTDLSLGRSGEKADFLVDLADNVRVNLRCRHALVLVPRGKQGAVGLLAFGRSSNAKENGDLWLGGVIQQLHLGASRQVELVQVNIKEAQFDFCSMRNWSEYTKEWNAMRDWLSHLLSEMLVQGVADHLPCAAVQKITSRCKDFDLWSSITDVALQNEMEKTPPPYSCWLEAFSLVDSQIPVLPAHELIARVRQRFSPLVEGTVHG